MADSIEEFLTDAKLTDSNLHESAALIHTFLTGGATVSDTADHLTALVHDPATVTIDEILEECIVGLAEELSEPHEALVQLVHELRCRQQQQQTGEEAVSKYDRSLSYSLSERWLRYGDPDPASIWHGQLRLEWFNLNHFAALLYTAGFHQLSAFGQQTLEYTLKRGGWRVSWKGNESMSDDLIAVGGHVPAALDWIHICGQGLYDDCETIRTNWTIWKADIEWIAEQAGLDEETRSLSRQMHSEMQQIS